MARTIVVGDVHACPEELSALLERARYAQGVDRLVLVGDLVARGPDSRGVVRRAVEYGATSVRGNHDEKVLTWWRVATRDGRDKADETVKLSTRHARAVDELHDEDFALLDSLPLVTRLDEHGAIVVHAGFLPGTPEHAQDPHVLLNIRSVRHDGTFSRRLDGEPWARCWPGPEHVIFGHDARRGLQLEPHATGLDTGCCYGRTLTALVLHEGERVPQDAGERRARLVSVRARRNYCAMGTGDGAE